jgi:hypothetical protein
VFTRRIMLCGLFALSVRNAVSRWRQCHGCCAAPYPSFDAPAHGPAPGCATCFSPAPVAGPVGPPVAGPVGPPVAGPFPVYSAPLPAPTGISPPTVFQSSEPPATMPKVMPK